MFSGFVETSIKRRCFFFPLGAFLKGFQLLVFGGCTQFVCVDHCFANFSKARLVSLRRNWSQGTLWSQRLPTVPLFDAWLLLPWGPSWRPWKRWSSKQVWDGKTEKIIIGIWIFGSVWYYILLLGGKKIDILHTSRALECFDFKLIYYSKLRQIRDAVKLFSMKITTWSLEHKTFGRF